MAERLIVVSGEHAYPTGDGLALVRRAGGLRFLSPAQAQTVRFKVVRAGDDCSDMPAEGAARLLQSGEIAVVAPATRKR